MRFRSDFVTNSSSSSFTCELCGRTESGMDYGLSDVEMVECVGGHTICEHEMLPVPKSVFIQCILGQEIESAKWCKKNGYVCDEQHTQSELDVMSDSEVADIFMETDDARYSMPEECCPICQFIEYSERDLSAYLEKKYGISRDAVFAKVKEVNKRRKKLYDGEYITDICQQFSLNPVKIVAGWKAQFETYVAFKKYLREK